MFDWSIFFILVLISIPGIIATTPGLVQDMISSLGPRLPEGKSLPDKRILVFLAGLQVLVLVMISAALGEATVPSVGLKAPVFYAIAGGGNVLSEVFPQVVPMLIGGIGGGVVLVSAYYLVFRPRLDAQTVRSMEAMRMKLGLAGRLLYGGILEEVLTRWGMMSLFTWIGMKLTGDITPAVMWSAIVVSGCVFGLLHLPSYVATGSRLTPMFVLLMLVLNLWASIVFGWLFWQYGLLAAIGAHMLFHLVWYPFDILYTRQARSEIKPQHLST